MKKHYFEAAQNPARPAATFGSVCRRCGEGISHDNHGEPDAAAEEKAVARLRAREVAKRNAKRPELQPVPMHEVPCDGQAHRPDVDQDHCMVCLHSRWGWLPIPAAFEDLDSYRNGAEHIADAADTLPIEREVAMLRAVLAQAWSLMTPEQRARLWEMQVNP